MKYFWECFTTTPMSPPDTGRITRAISVIRGLMDSIMIRMPTMVATEVIRVVMLCPRLWPKVSTSLVIRDSTSPTVRDSK